eukprot:Lithocolla_globosa_v1_NODE_383_length_4222_cov_8.644588.p2 type:complete len:237 gc:universal NODE_383_length_4222_cov_8.644588:3025-2315(-)
MAITEKNRFSILGAITEKNRFSILHVNARSLGKNFDRLSAFFDSLTLPFTLVAISETWIDEDDNNILSDVWEGYTLETKSRKRKGGGVGAYVLTSTKYKIRKDIEIEECDNLWIEFEGNQRNQLVCIAYHSPDKQDTELFSLSLGQVFASIPKKKYDITFVGDINIDLLKTNLSDDYLSNLLCHGFKSLIAYPTRINEQTGTETLIDHIFTNNTVSCIRAGLIWRCSRSHPHILRV